MDKQSLLAFITEGLSIRQIAKSVEKSPTSVRHWLEKYGLKTSPVNRPRPPKFFCIPCNKQLGPEDFYETKKKYPYCKNCMMNQVNERKKILKAACVDHLGSKCKICSYDACINALEFHHLDPLEKDFQISSVRTIFNEDVKTELDKCILLCANCHRETHAGLHGERPIDVRLYIDGRPTES